MPYKFKQSVRKESKEIVKLLLNSNKREAILVNYQPAPLRFDLSVNIYAGRERLRRKVRGALVQLEL